jgi:protein-tyrosine phosphatase
MRSRTAESIYSDDSRYIVKSAGISKKAQVRLTEDLIIWADIVFVMQSKYRDVIVDLYPIESLSKEIVSLDIPDTYYYMETLLVELIKSRVNSFLLY